MKDICFIGHITRDHVITPTTDVYMAGGTSYYCARALKSLPPKVSYSLVTATGDDNEQVIEAMLKDDIDVKRFPCAHSVFFENRYGSDPDNRTQRVLALADPFTVEEVKPLQAKLYHLGTLLSGDFPVEVVEELANKGKVSIDVQGYLRRVVNERVYETDWPDKHKILSMTHLLQLDEIEMVALTGSHDVREAAKTISSWGVKEVVITLGGGGSMIYDGSSFYEIPAYKPKEIVDATGCGDTYSAGYLYMRLQGASYEDAGKFAAAMCTLKLQHSGPFSSDIDSVLKIMEQD